MCLALRYLHKEKRIVHRDLSPNNIMLGEDDKVTISESGQTSLFVFPSRLLGREEINLFSSVSPPHRSRLRPRQAETGEQRADVGGRHHPVLLVRKFF